jgi:chromosome partitioning protein
MSWVHAMLARMTKPYSIAVLNQKGGVGKSMVSQNLAAAAHLAGHRTILLDLDSQGTSWDWFARREATSRLRGLVVQKVDRVLTQALLDDLTRGFDVAVFDGPPAIGKVTQAAAVASDVILIPLRAGPAEWWAAATTVETLDHADAIREQLGLPPVRRVWMLNETDGRVKEAQFIEQALRDAQLELLPVRWASRVAYNRARGIGEATVTNEPDGAAAREVLALYDAIFAMRVPQKGAA